MEERNYDIEIKKILLSGLQNSNYSLTTAIDDVLHNLLLLSNSSSSEYFIEIASQFIIAYLQLGFSYLEHKQLFDSILQKAEFNSDEISSFQEMNPSILTNKAQLRSIMGRWPVSAYNSHTITAAINDIIFHVRNDDLGTYQYYTAKKDSTYTAFYQLTISPGYALFHDIFKNKFYRLIKK